MGPSKVKSNCRVIGLKRGWSSRLLAKAHSHNWEMIRQIHISKILKAFGFGCDAIVSGISSIQGFVYVCIFSRHGK